MLDYQGLKFQASWWSYKQQDSYKNVRMEQENLFFVHDGKIIIIILRR